MEGLRFAGSKVGVHGGQLTDAVLLYCSRSLGSALGIHTTDNPTLAIVRAHSFIINGVSGIDSPVTGSMYVYPALWSFAKAFSRMRRSRASSASIFDSS